MKRVTVDMAAKATGLFDVHRFRQHTKKERESAWHAFRALGVGGSDMSTILGLNPYSTPYDLWLEKTNRQQPEDISGKWAIIKGNALEVELRRRFRQLHQEYQVIDGTDISLVSKQHPLMHASLDGFLYDSESDSFGVLEIKTANANRGRTDWHDETGELVAPQYYMAQVTHYMAVTGFTWGVFYADIGESEPVEVRFERDEDDIHAVIKAAEDFWGFVTRGEMPALTGADVAKAYPEPSEGIEDMAKKTVIRRAFPYLPVSVEARDAAASDDQTPDYSDVFRPLPTVTADDSPVDVSVDEPEEPEQPQPSPVEAKRSEMIRRFQTLGVASDAEACETISKILNREVKSSDELGEAELDKVIGQLKASVKEGE